MGTTQLVKKAIKAVKEEGIQGCAKKTKSYLENQKRLRRKIEKKYKDILFISGCGEDLPHPWRYRVKHQREQLEAYNYSTDEVYFTQLDIDQIRYYRAFVFFRCPMTETIGTFVDLAKQLNKTIIYDIDDLVIDTQYTDQIKYVMAMPEEDKKAYDNNVMNMQKLLRKCDFAITSTDCLAEELRKYIPKVYINRNVASEKMIQLSKEAIVKIKKDNTKVKIGYFSGSITHNADFEMIKPVLIEVLKKYENVELYLAGELDLPVELNPWKERIKKYILSFLLGMLMLIGVFIKPTVIIMPIAIIIIEILNLNKEKLKNIVYSIIVMIFFIMGCGISYLGYNIQKNQIFGELISKQAQEDFKRSYTHFLMMGMQERQNDVIGDGKNQTLYGTYNVQDDLNTYSVKGYKEKQEYNLKIIKERLKNFGIIGYIKFLYNKANWILSDGTFYYGYEGTWIVDGYQNQNKVAKIVQKFITVDSKAYKYITANIMQISWLIILFGLMLSYSKEKNEYLDIGKLAIIGIILFILIFEGRARYLVNYIPIFIFIGVDGLKISLNKILTMKDK